MATTTSTDDRTDSRDTDIPQNDLVGRIGYVIGVDGDGCAHVHYPARNTIDVFETDDSYEVGDRLAGEADITADLDGRPLWHWMDYTTDERGEWQTTTHRAADGFGDEEVSE